MKGVSVVILAVLLVLFAAAASTAQDELGALKQEMKKMQDRIDKLEADKAAAEPTVEAKAGKIKVGALLQQWYISTDRKPPETQYEGFGRSATLSSYTNNSFRTRRARLNFTGDLTEQLGWYAQFEFARNNDTSSEQYDDALLDLHLNYRLNEHDTITVGQFKVPFGYESLESAANLDTLERAMMYTSGSHSIGNYWDVGVQYIGQYDNTDVRLAFVQGEGQGKYDADDHLDICARVNHALAMIEGLQFGASIYSGKDVDADQSRNWWGAHLCYDTDRVRFKAEYATRNAFYSPEVDLDSWYALVSYDFTPDLEFVVRYEKYDPDNDTSDDETDEWTAGFSYFLDGQNSKIQLNYVKVDPKGCDTTNLIIIGFQAKA